MDLHLCMVGGQRRVYRYIELNPVRVALDPWEGWVKAEEQPLVDLG
ncbi:MAG TPA: hypothetical protein VHF02_09635 [Luteimonas sp.]|nr:hypothetical protein [Luteimonas sp.]